MGDDNIHWEGVGWIPPQGVQQYGGTETLEGEVHEVGVSPTGGINGGGGVTGGGYLRLLPP